MAISNYLAKIKSSGVYRYVFDKSEIPASQRNSLRLVVGYSERGPFNTPVYISDAQEFIATFGNVSRRMERKGVFFHRLALQCLEAGPILALNIKPFKNESAKMISFNASDIVCKDEVEINIDADSIELTAYDEAGKKEPVGVTRCFVKPVPDYIKEGDTFKFVGSRYAVTEDEYTKTTDTNPAAYKEYYVLSDSNYSKVNSPVKNNLSEYYEVIAFYKKTTDKEIVDEKDYYVKSGADYAKVRIPEANSLSDYYELSEKVYKKTTDTDIVGGKEYYAFKDSAYSKVESPTKNDLSKYYEKLTEGVYKKTTDKELGGEKEYYILSNLTYSKVKAPNKDVISEYYEITKKIIGGATHIRTIEKGVEYYWTPSDAAKINAPELKADGTFIPGSFKYDRTYFNGKYYENVDGKINLDGKQLKSAILDDALIALDGTNTAGERWTTIYDTNRFWKVTDNIMDITPLVAGGAAKKDYMRIVQTSSKEDSVTVFMRPYIPAGYNIKISDWYASEVAEEMPAYMESIKDHYLSEFFMEIFVFKGDFRSPELFTEAGTLGAHVRQATGESKFLPFCNVDGNGADAEVRSNANFCDAFGRPADALAAMANVSTSNFIGRYQGIMLPNFKDTSGTFISIDSVFNSDYSAHKCLMALNEQLLDDAYEADLNDNGEYDVGAEQTPTNPESSPSNTRPATAGKIGSVADLIHQLTSALHSVKTGSGVNYEDYDAVQSVPANASVVGYYLEGYNYTTILKNESGKSLVEDKIYSVFGYKGIYEALTNNVDVDYKYLVDTFQGYPGIAMKANMSAIVKQKFNALGILNFPPMADCAIHMGYPGLTGGFDMKEVVKRGSGITLPAEVQGASWVAYFTQLQMSDGANKFIIPSAGLVSNLFMEKWKTRLPYYIVAGPNHGRIVYPGVVGTDYNYSRPDLDALEPFGVNAIVYIPRKGFVINSNQTAKQSPVSALSKIHVRELVTFLQDEVEDMLYNYQWELNTATLRDAVTAKAKTILGLIQANGGIYDFRVQCDDQNNTPEIIDNEMLVLDIEIEPSRGAGKMVQTLTIHRTGGIAATPRS